MQQGSAVFAWGMSLVAKVAAIKTSLGLPPDMGLFAALGTACELMGIVSEPGTPLPHIADRLVEAIGCTVVVAPPVPPPATSAPVATRTAASAAAPPVAAPYDPKNLPGGVAGS